MRVGRLTILIIVMFWVVSYSLYGASISHFSKELTIYFLDVGQGDSTLVVTPDGYSLLIDTGRDPEVVNKLDDIFSFSRRELEAVVITHPDSDHYESILSLVDSYTINSIFWNKSLKQNSLLDWTTGMIEGISSYDLKSDNDFRLGCCVFVDVLWPLESQNVASIKEANESSITVKITYGEFSTYLSGDLGAENEVLTAEGIGEIDLLKVGHHGSSTSTGEELLELANPKISVISVGASNSYGHPTKEVLDRLSSHSIPVLRTDMNGTIKVRVSEDGVMTFSAEKDLEKFSIYL